jgi:O-antigen/teichoic acid export membrane protein
VRWTFVALLLRQVGRLGFAVLLARWIGPESFGIASEATIYVVLTAVLLESGFGLHLVQRQRLTEYDVGAVWWWSIGSSGLVAVVTLVVAPYLAAAFSTPELTAVLRVLAIGVAVKGLAVVPAALLARRLRFRALAVAEVVATLVAAAVGILAAQAGAGYWALVLQQLTTDVLFTVALLAAARALPTLRALQTDRQAVADTRRFGAPVLGSQLVGYASRNLDNIIIGIFLGAAPLAFYMVAYRFMMVPVQLLGSMANRVAFPVFSRLQHDRAQVSRYYLRITRVIAVAVIPTMLLVSVLGRELVLALVGPDWQPAVILVQVLAVNAILEALMDISGAVFLGFGRTDLTLRWSVIPLLLAAVSFFAGLPWGVLGVSVAYSIATVATAPMILRAISRLCGFGAREWIAAVLPPLLAGSAGAAACWAIRAGLLSLGWGPWPVLLVAGAGGGLAFLAALQVGWPSVVGETIDTAKLVLRPKRVQLAAA